MAHPIPAEILHGLYLAGLDVSHEAWCRAMSHAEKLRDEREAALAAALRKFDQEAA